jgi:hypothetical protein
MYLHLPVKYQVYCQSGHCTELCYAAQLIEGQNIYPIHSACVSEEKSIFWEMMISVIVRKKVHMNMCLNLNCYQGAAI